MRIRVKMLDERVKEGEGAGFFLSRPDQLLEDAQQCLLKRTAFGTLSEAINDRIKMNKMFQI